jgi:hypothetical protein
VKRDKAAGASWPRLHIYEISRPTEDDLIGKLLAKLEADAPVDMQTRHHAATYIRGLLMRPKLLHALRAQPGAPRTSNAQNLALDYAVCCELLGKAAAARKAVALAWGARELTVKHAWRKWKMGAQWRLEHLIGGKEGRVCYSRTHDAWTEVEFWTRRDLFEAVRADLQERRRRQPRRRIGRKK